MCCATHIVILQPKTVKFNKVQLNKLKMGNILNLNKKVKTTKKSFASAKKVDHKAKVMTLDDVKNNRSMAYTYLTF